MEWSKLIHGDAPKQLPEFRTGDDVRVLYRIVERGKERLGQFEGTVIRYRGSGTSKTFTVRRVTHGEGVERIFPIDAQIIARVEVIRRGRVKRSRLYFLRRTIGKLRIATVESQNTTEKKENTGITIGTQTADAEATADKSEGIVSSAQKVPNSP